MTAAGYEKLLGWLRANPVRCRCAQLLTQGLPVLFMAVYAGGGALLLLRRDERIWRFLLVPAAALGCCMLLRRLIDRPRPYEVYGFRPLISRDKRGRSCPSNHTVSAFVIALAFLRLSPSAGAVLLAMAAMVGVSRILSGVHWPGDVGAGLLLAMAADALGTCFFSFF